MREEIRRYKILVIVLLVLPMALLAQKRTTYIVGNIVDAEFSKPIKGVNIQLIGSFLGATTDANGNYRIRTRNRNKFELKYSYVGNETVIKSFDLSEDSSSFVVEDIVLTKQRHLLPQATITAEYFPEIVYSSYKHNVADFIFLKHGYLFLAYDKFQKYSTKLILLDKYNRVMIEFFTPEPIVKLYTDFEDTHYAIAKESVFKVKINAGRIQLEKVDKEFFDLNILKMASTLDNSNVVLSNYEWFYPRFSYFEVNPWTQKRTEVIEIVDPELEHLMRMQYYFLSSSDKTFARKLGAKYGTEKQIAAALMTGFPNSIYYEKLYAPLLVINDTVNVFDHYSDYLYKYKSDVGVIDSVSIDYHLSERAKDWEREVILDEETNQIYAVFDRDGYKILKRINRFTGKIEGEFKLYYKWIDRIRIKNNEVYYVYRPYESLRKKFLYREMIAIN